MGTRVNGHTPAGKGLRTAAFTLFEVAVVLVIIGLIIGATLTGASLIRSAELQSVIVDMNNYVTGVTQFQAKYRAWPGDMPNATTYWGTNPNCATVGAGTGTQTCNGNGDGSIGVGGEYYWLWQHLYNAGLWKNKLTGANGPSPGSAGLNDVIGTNVPKSRYRYPAGYTVCSVWASHAYTSWTGNILTIASCCYDNYLDGRSMSSLDSYQLDSKIDDGRPDSGMVQANNSYWSGCASSATAPATYTKADSGAACMPLLSYDYGLHK